MHSFYWIFRHKDKESFFCAPCMKGCIVGSLLCGIALAVLLTFKLTSASACMHILSNFPSEFSYTLTIDIDK